MRTALLLSLSALLVGCPPARSDDDDSATCTTGLRVCATYDGAAAPGSATVRPEPGGEETEGPLAADGCTTFELEEGTWEWSARHATDTCESAFVEATVSACEVTEVSVELIEWCFDGLGGE